MPGAVALSARCGFLGKLPARGDFVSRGLPRGFAEPWDAWLAEAMSGSRAILGEDWLPAWLEAPIWRFALPAGHCGPEAAAGVMLPSVDRSGRHWPLTLAATFAGLSAAPAPDPAWLDLLEAAGLDAVLADAEPDRVAERIAALPAGCGTGGALGSWWTIGAPRVAPRQFVAGALPGPAAFAAMLQDATPPAPGDAVP
ncbi:type VI secretion system-associated protein TagF [Falsiroseomonas sp.]|uniref:type VI secretion system-associated protein TagF n=1 Tax=Falsiroseomonas sp. TaxID=2870721 RepID=UPI0035680A32